MNPNITVYGAYWCPDCRRSKRFLSEHQIAYDWIDIEQDDEARTYVEKLNHGKRIIPTITFGDGSFLVEPSNAELAQKLNLTTKDPHPFHDVTIIGAGPAGLATAIYNARDGFSVMVVDEGALGGQASTTENLDNYPGFPDGIRGADWSQRVVEQARRFGVEFLQAQTVVGLRRVNNTLCVKTGDSTEYESSAVLIAMGADYRRLGIEGEDFIGAGVHFCSTCDGPFYKGKQVAVVGGGNSATDEHGFILTGYHLARHPGWSAGRDPDILETSLPGVFAAGDVRAGSTKQVASAAGEGATAALLIREYLNSH